MPDSQDGKDTSGSGWFTRIRSSYAEQAAKQDVKRGRRIGLIVPTVLVLFGGYRLLTRPDRTAITFTAGVMPACDAVPSRRLLKQAIDEAGPVKAGTAALRRIGAIQETAFVPVGPKGTEVRMCQADVFFNVGRHDVSFTLEWTSRAKDELWIEAETPF